MSFCGALSPLQASNLGLAPALAMDWHVHSHDELCLVLAGTPAIGHAGGKVFPEPGCLFLFVGGEAHALGNAGVRTARLWSLEFRISSGLKTEFHALFERSPETRVLKLSPLQQQRFSSTCQKIAFEKGAAGLLGATAASVLLALQLIDVTRWFSARRDAGVPDTREALDPQCFELWQKIHRHALEPATLGPMLFGLNPGHDSLRHRFRRLFGISPQGMLVRLRMDRAKQLLLTSDLTVKEVAHEIGYPRQHDFSRAFHKCTGMSPSLWRSSAREVGQPL